VDAEVDDFQGGADVGGQAGKVVVHGHGPVGVADQGMQIVLVYRDLSIST
jgi:hypothetical protein